MLAGCGAWADGIADIEIASQITDASKVINSPKAEGSDGLVRVTGMIKEDIPASGTPPGVNRATLTEVEPGDTFRMEVWLQDIRTDDGTGDPTANQFGVSSSYIDIEYDAEFFALSDRPGENVETKPVPSLPISYRNPNQYKLLGPPNPANEFDLEEYRYPNGASGATLLDGVLDNVGSFLDGLSPVGRFNLFQFDLAFEVEALTVREDAYTVLEGTSTALDVLDNDRLVQGETTFDLLGASSYGGDTAPKFLVFGDTGAGAGYGGTGSIVPEDLIEFADPSVTVVNDGVLQIVSFTQGSRGTVARAPGNPNLLQYTPTAPGAGTDTFTYDAADGLGHTKTATVTVTVLADDTAGITVTPISGLTTTEAGDTDVFTVVLDSEPTGDVTIAVASNDTTEGTVSENTLTFTPLTWMTPQTVTVTGVDDYVEDGDIPCTIVLGPVTGSDGEYSAIDPDDVTVTNTDDDEAGILVDPTSQLTTDESGGWTTFTVVLTSEPTSDVQIPVFSSNMAEGTVSPSTLSFDADDWNQPKTVTVTGVGDSVDDGDIPYTIVLGPVTSFDPKYSVIDPDDVAVANLDDDTADVTITWQSQPVTNEGGGKATFDVALVTASIADVTVTVSSDDATEGSVSPTPLVFTSLNWNEPQGFTITGVDDHVDDGDVTYTIVTEVSSSDPVYNDLDVDDVTVTNLDDDTAGITVTPISGLTTTEAGDTDVFTVLLDSEPTAEVTIAVTSDDTTEGTISAAELTFTPTNWQQPQTVTITGVDDGLDDDDVAYTIVTASADSDDPNYDGFNADDVTVTNVDDETFVPVDLGLVDFKLLETLDPSAGVLWFRLETAHDGWLTVQSASEQTAEQLKLELHNPADTSAALAASQSSDAIPRFDYAVEQGRVYLVKVTGTASDVSLLLANLVYEAGTAITVHGTAENDILVFDAAASREITINGVAYHYEDTEVSTVDFAAGEGRDEVWLYDSVGNESVEAWPDHAILTNGAGDSVEDYTVEVAGIEDLQAYATRGGIDSAVFHGSEAADKVKSFEDSVRLRAKDCSYTTRAKKYDTIVSDAGPAGKDLAIFNGSELDDTFTYLGADNSARFEGKHRNHTAIGFGSVVVRAGGGENDAAHFTDLPGPAEGTDDVFYFKSHKTVLVNHDVKVTTRAFDEIHATASESGLDVARVYDTVGDDHLEVEGDTARLYRRIGDDLDLLYEAVAFERVKAYSTEGDDTKDVKDHTIDLILDGWDS